MDSDDDFIIESVQDLPGRKSVDELIISNHPQSPKSTGAKKKDFNYSQALSTNLKENSFAAPIDFNQFSNYKSQEYLPSNFDSTIQLINEGIRHVIYVFFGI